MSESKKQYNEGLCSQFFGFVMTFIRNPFINPFHERMFGDIELCAEVTQNYLELIDILGPARSISELPENLQKISIQAIPYFLECFTCYTKDDIPY